MWVRVTNFRGDPERVDAGIALVRNEVLPTTGRMKGSLGLVMGVDRSSGRTTVMTCWDDRASLDASHQAVVAQRASGGREIGSSETSVEVFEVALLHLVKEPGAGACTRTTRTAVAPEDMDKAVASFETVASPVYADYDGLCAVMVLVDRETGAFQSTMVLDSREALDASAAKAPAVRDALIAEVPSLTIVEIYDLELVVSALKAP